MSEPSRAALRRQCYAQRLARLRKEMTAAGVDLLVAYGSGAHSFLASNPAWWLSGFKQMGPHAAVLTPLDGEPTLFVTPVWDRSRAVESSAIERVVATDPLDFVAAVAEAARNRHVDKARVAVAGGQTQPQEISAKWQAAFGRAPLNGDKLISDLARIRDDWSLDCVRRAVDIAERGYARLLETARPGMAECDLAAELDVAMREFGAEDNFQLMSASQHNRSVHQPTSRLLARGDILLAEITPAVDGEFIQICRTAIFGPPTAIQREAFALLDEALRAGMACARPGASTAKVVAAINAPIEAKGYAQYTKPPYMRTRGHSMALGSMDPEIASDSGHVLQENMVFVMHPNQYIPETGYMMCGEPVIVTAKGAEPLTRRMGKLDSIAS